MKQGSYNEDTSITKPIKRFWAILISAKEQLLFNNIRIARDKFKKF